MSFTFDSSLCYQSKSSNDVKEIYFFISAFIILCRSFFPLNVPLVVYFRVFKLLSEDSLHCAVTPHNAFDNSFRNIVMNARHLNTATNVARAQH